MFVHHRTRGVILKKTNRGESNQLLTIFTEDFGRVEILAKGIRKISSKLRSGAELFYLSDIEFIQGRTHKTLTDAVLRKKFLDRSSFPESWRTAYFIADAVNGLTAPQEEDKIIFDLISTSLYSIGSLKNAGQVTDLAYLYFLWQLLVHLGYKPETSVCLSCRQTLGPGKLFFSVRDGGAVCFFCFVKNRKQDRISIDNDALRALRILTSESWPVPDGLNLNLTARSLSNLKMVSGSYLNFLKSTLGPRR